MTIVIATARPDTLGEFAESLSASSGREVALSGTGASALEAVAAGSADLVVVDEGLSDFTPLDLVLEIVKTNAMTNTAVITSMSAKEFHDASEGFGVLSSLPPTPNREDGKKLAALLAKM